MKRRELSPETTTSADESSSSNAAPPPRCCSRCEQPAPHCLTEQGEIFRWVPALPELLEKPFDSWDCFYSELVDMLHGGTQHPYVVATGQRLSARLGRPPRYVLPKDYVSPLDVRHMAQPIAMKTDDDDSGNGRGNFSRFEC